MALATRPPSALRPGERAPGKRASMVIDLKRCIGCQSCTLACKMEHGTPPAVFRTKVLTQEVGKYTTVRRTYLPVLCNHCENPPCQRACPTGATIRTEEGIVWVDKQRCVGCRACIVACPYQNRFYLESVVLFKNYYPDGPTPFERMKRANMVRGTVDKCDFCIDRLREGLEPACVVACPTEARKFGDLNDPASEVSTLIRARGGFQLLAEYDTNPSVYYLPG